MRRIETEKKMTLALIWQIYLESIGQTVGREALNRMFLISPICLIFYQWRDLLRSDFFKKWARPQIGYKQMLNSSSGKFLPLEIITGEEAM